MERTNIEYFNYYLKLFLKNIMESFPEYKDDLFSSYKDLLIVDNCNNDKYVKKFMKKLRKYGTEISNKDIKLFESGISILKTVDFSELWEKDISKNNREKIWEYIQTLYLLGNTIISDTNRIKKLVANFKNINTDDIEDSVSPKKEEEDDDEIEIENDSDSISKEDQQLLDIMSNLKNNKLNDSDIPEDFLNNGLIGSLAQELSEEIKLDDLNMGDKDEDILGNLMSGDNPMKFMNLLQKVGQTIQNKVESGDLNQTQLVDEAQKMMGSLKGNNPLFNNMFNMAQNAQNANNPTRDKLKKKLELRQKNPNK